VLAANDDDPNAHALVGVLNQSIGEPAVARGHFDRALALEPDNVGALYSLGIAAAADGRIVEGVQSMARILGLRGVPKSELDYLVLGSTIPWHWKFWTAPLVASCMGHRIPGYHVEQACATGLQATLLGGAEIESGAHDVVGVLTFDRTSDSPVGVFPERRAHERTQAIADVWDNFGFDPATGNAMITAAGILSGVVSGSGQLGFHPVYLALAIGCGSKPIAWMNDSGFWVICKMSGMTESEGLKYVTPMSAAMGVIGLIAIVIFAAVLPFPFGGGP